MIKTISKLNLPLLIAPVLLFVLGFVTLVSTSEERGRIHVLFFVLGLVLYLSISFQDYFLFYYFWKYLYIITLFLLVLTYLIGDVRFGSSRWLDVGLFSFQPSEIAKFTIIISITSYIYEKRGDFGKFRNILKVFGLFVPVILLIFIQPDLGTSLIMLSIFIGLLFFSGLNKMYFLVMAIFFGIASNPLWSALQDYQKDRILVFLNPKLDVLGAGYNVIQSLIAVGSGGIFGTGFSRGTQTHLNFLPSYWTDFAFASFAEEWGFVGVVTMFILFFILLISIMRVVTKTKEPFGQMVCFGIFVIFLVQFVINVGMNLGLMPATGIPLPLVSYGGSSMLLSMVLLGIVQSVWIRSSG